MAIVNGYLTLAEFKSHKTITTTDTVRDSVIEILIEASSRFIDTYTGRTFYARTETHTFDIPNGRTLVMDDDLLTVTTLTNGDSTVITSADYILLPRNNTPYYALKLKDTSTVYWQSSSSGGVESVISLAGTWGWSSSAPTNIKLACIEITNNEFQRRSGQGVEGIAQATAMGVMISPSSIPGWAAMTLNPYKKRS